ncbi:hypothetical protein GCM10027258_62890 [Amycolatopsis stemonae]
MTEDLTTNPADGHQFHFSVDIQGAYRVGDGPYVDADQPAGLPFTVTVRAWNLRDACLAAAGLALGGWTAPDETTLSTFELLDAAAERGHNAMFEGDLPAEGIERDLWHKVVLAVLDDPRLLPHWARAARVDADNWHRQCTSLDAQLEEKGRETRMWHDHVRYWRDAWYVVAARLYAVERGLRAGSSGPAAQGIRSDSKSIVDDRALPTLIPCTQDCGMVYAGTEPIPAGVLPHSRMSDGKSCPGRFVERAPEVSGG